TGTGAFYGAGEPELSITTESGFWSQPWRFVDDKWDFQEITLTGTAAAIDQAAIQAERERLFVIWNQATDMPQWDAPFHLPIDSYLSITSDFGARRSYNGGPYSTYHEGVDFAAYGGTPVTAPAAGTVVIAETLFVRGGAVIVDHGLGIYSGYYHMADVAVAPGQIVVPGQLLGEVGTTGLSTGNHLHWDLLVNGIWVDAFAFYEQDMACWVLTGLGRPCSS
ncbi:MAG: M23 family metallopeptidase, partial [Anaerolineales bacterium]|nr:M23 family metallopeptidase [Anaerolineales bacterium]